MEIIQNKFKKVADFCYELFKIAEIPIYNSKFSNRMYSNFQKLYLLIYKQFRKFTYEELLTDIADNISLRRYLGLNKLPHYTTLIKFASNLPAKVLDRLVLAFRKIIPKPKRVALDATGISLDNASPHYCKRVGKRVSQRPYMKTSFLVDIDDYIILLCKMRKGHRHDTVDAKPMIRKLSRYYDPDIFYADRGYDDNETFKLCFEELEAYPLILQRNQDVPKWRKSGVYRKQTIDTFDYGEYLQRNKIETLNSMIKRRFNSNVKAKTDKMQRVEIYSRVIAFNIDRLIRIAQAALVILIRIIRVSYQPIFK